MMWLVFGLLAIIAAGAVVLSLRKKNTLDTSAAETAIFEDQLREIDADAARGVIGDQEADGARIEVKRRLVAALRRDGTSESQSDGGHGIIFATAIAVPLMGAGIYAFLGAPTVPSIPFAEQAQFQQEISEEDAQVTDLAEQLRTRLQAEPGGGPSEGWVLLGRTYMGLERYADAAEAFRVVAERPDAPSAAWSLYAEALVFAGNGTITPQAEIAIQKSYELDPVNPAATYYRALVLDQNNDTGGAHDLLVARIEQNPYYQPWMDVFVETANQMGQTLGREPITLPPVAPSEAPATPGPSAEQVEAASEMSEEDRAAFIKSMVDGLAARLAEDPSDIDGWLRLANAYRVLGQSDLARNAYLSAREAIGDSSADPRLKVIDDALSEFTDQ